MVNPNGKNGCWFLPKEGLMPNDFELYQTIPSGKIEPGRYLVCCRLWLQDGHLGTTRLFANNNVQYYGMDIDYARNLTDGEENSFAGYIGGQDNNFILQDMYVYVDVKEGEDLRIGIRSGNRNADGSEGCDRCGWFKTDYFRIHKADLSGLGNITAGNSTTRSEVYDLAGRMVASDISSIAKLPAGIYISNGQKFVKK